jgi:hypothetical protein
MHLTDDELLALIDGELTPRGKGRAVQHLDECLSCAQRLEGWRESEAHAAELLRATDHPAPDVSADQVMALASRPPSRRWRAELAAGLALLILTAAATAAVPGSLLRRYAERLLARTSFSDTRVTPMGHHESSSPHHSAASGIAWVPVGDVEILFRDTQSAGVMRITLGDSGAVRVAHQGGSAGYSLTNTGIVVENAGSSASYAIVLPRGEARVVIRVGDRAVFKKRDSQITADGVRESRGTYVVAFTKLGRRKQP